MRLYDKIKEIEIYLQELEDIKSLDFESYQKDNKTKAACERYFERIIEAIIDLTFLVIKEKEFSVPEDDKSAFDILSVNNVITQELAEKLKDAKGMRNILVHEYGTIDDKQVYNSINHEISGDAEEFIKNIKKGSSIQPSSPCQDLT